jgi:hypothetical protein
MTHGPTTVLAINPVLAERADDFEEWLRTVVVPAMRTHQPQLVDKVTVLRATEAEGGVITYAFLGEGGEPADWELEPLLERALGADGAARAMSQMSGMLQREQYGWEVMRVPVAGSVPDGSA